jgi:hypothetical protein
MKRSLVSVLVAIVVLGIAVFAAAGSSGSSADSDEKGTSSSNSKKHDNRGQGREKLDMGERGDHEQPAWAQGKNKKLDKAERRDLREEWRSLSPEQRRALMDKLIREHRDAMREWRTCMEAGGDDCERPFPPGLAKLR